MRSGIPQRSRHAVHGAVLSLAVAAAVGCSGSPPPTTTAPSAPAPSVPGAGPVATPERPLPTTATSTAPDAANPTTATPEVIANLPAAARVRTATGAEAFVKYYMDLTNDIAVKPRLGLLTPLSTPSCRSCRGMEEVTAALIAKGAHYAASPLTLEQVSGLSGMAESDPVYRVGVVARQGGHPILDTKGTVLKQVPVSRETFIAYVMWDGHMWKVDKIKTFEPNDH